MTGLNGRATSRLGWRTETHHDHRNLFNGRRDLHTFFNDYEGLGKLMRGELVFFMGRYRTRVKAILRLLQEKPWRGAVLVRGTARDTIEVVCGNTLAYFHGFDDPDAAIAEIRAALKSATLKK